MHTLGFVGHGHTTLSAFETVSDFDRAEFGDELFERELSLFSQTTLPSSYQPRPWYQLPAPYQYVPVFVHPVFSLDEAIRPFRGINNTTPLKMCLKAYEYCENYVMQHSLDEEGNPYRIFDSNLEWTDDWSPEACHIDPKYIMNARMTKGALVIVAGALAKRIPVVGQEMGSGLILFGLSEIWEGFKELPPMPSFYPK